MMMVFSFLAAIAVTHGNETKPLIKGLGGNGGSTDQSNEYAAFRD